MAEALGGGSVLLLRNHGVLVAERDVRWAVLASVLLERSLFLQTIASSLGALRPIPTALLPDSRGQVPVGFRRRVLGRLGRALRRRGRDFGMPGER